MATYANVHLYHSKSIGLNFTSEFKVKHRRDILKSSFRRGFFVSLRNPSNRPLQQDRSKLLLCTVTEEKKSDTPPNISVDEVEETTKKWGLEAGLWKVFTAKDDSSGTGKKTSRAKELLTRYGSAYLLTSISLSLISIIICYFLVDNGVDINSLLQKVGIETSATSEKVGTFALAYAAHKAASPIRFPPTVALTPIVAKLIGKEVKEDKVTSDK